MPSCGMTVLLIMRSLFARCMLQTTFMSSHATTVSNLLLLLVASWEAFLHQRPYGAHCWRPLLYNMP